MASIQRRGRKGIYHAMWRDGSGVLQSRTTKTTNPGDAQAQADAWEALEKTPPEKVIEKNFHKVTSQIYKRVTNKKLQDWTVKNYAKRWLSRIEHDLEPSSHDNYETAINEFAEAFPDYSLRQVEREDILRHRDSIKDGLAKSTVNLRMAIIKQMFTAAIIDGLIEKSPMEHLRRIKQRSSDTQQPEPFSVDQLKKVIGASDPEWQSMVVHGYYTGQRLGDIAKMPSTCIDLERRQVRMVTGKSDHLVIVEMPDAYFRFCDEQLKHIKPGRPLHPKCYATLAKMREGERERTGTLSNRFAKILVKAGLRKSADHRKRKDGKGRKAKRTRNPLSFHSLRHSLISHLASAGVDRSLVQDIVGHDNEAVNEQYTHFNASTKRAAMEKLPDILG